MSGHFWKRTSFLRRRVNSYRRRRLTTTAPLVKQGDNRLDRASPFGMGLYLYRYGGDAAGFATMDRAAQMGAAAGVKWSREEFNWARIEVARGKYDWSFYDQVVATAKRHGDQRLRPVGLLVWVDKTLYGRGHRGLLPFRHGGRHALSRRRPRLGGLQRAQHPSSGRGLATCMPSC